MINPKVIFNFNKSSSILNWITVDDIVMGGLSSSLFRINTAGNGIFEGNISLDNNGGFSSVRYQVKELLLKNTLKLL